MPGEGTDGLYPICFGVSCTFFAVKLLSTCKVRDEDWCKVRDQMLQGGAQLLGLLVWRVQKDWQEGERAEAVWKLECTEKEVEDLKRQRREDAKANEKVVSIYATQEQTWFGERNRLRLQIGALLNQLSVFEKRRAECIQSLSTKIHHLQDSLASNELMLEHELNRSKELQEELRKVENAAAVQVEEHAAEAWKHKTAFVQLVSSHRQLEAEFSRASRQVEVGKAELNLVLEQKLEAVSTAQKLSLELTNLRKEAEQKYQTVIEIERYNSRRHKHSLRGMWYKTRAKTSEHKNVEEKKKYGETWEQRHHLELNSFAEQMRLRDEQIEVLHWRLLSTEIDFKQLQSHLEGLNQDKALLRQVNLKLEEQLLDYEADLHYLRNRVASKPSSEERSITESEKEEHKDEVEIDENKVTTEQRINEKITSCPWKMDIRALGVFFKVKRLKQQLMMLERFTAELKSVKEKDPKDDKKSFLALMSLLNKQVGRYEALQARIDELCNRMNEESDQNGRHARPTLTKKSKDEIKALERYLQEALQLQRYMVATGQKLTEIQTGINVTFCVIADEMKMISSINMTKLACSMRDLLNEVQKGLEIQSSRIIGDLEGTLACDGIIHLKSLP